MKVINITLHITHDEIISYLEKWVDLYKLKFGVQLIADGFVFSEKSIENINIELLRKVKTLYLSKSNFILCSANSEFLESNPNILSIRIGEETDLILRETWVYTLKIMDDLNSFKLWKKLSDEIKASTIVGGYSILKINNIRKFQNNIRYTKGAQKTFENGKIILNPYNDKITFELTKKDSSTYK